jgi:nucleotide-binding universal stress UspA family protein
MITNSSILVPTDFSRKSETAIRYACEIALCTGSEILFLNVVEPPYDFPSRSDEIVKEMKKTNASTLEKLIDDLHSVDEFRFIKMKGKVEVGNVNNEILEEARSGRHGLIAVGLGGEHDLKKALYGSITNNLLLESPIPVFAISKQISYRNPKQMIFATDFRERDFKPIKKIRGFARDLGVNLRLVHIVTNGSAVRKKADRFEDELRSRLKDSHISIELHEDNSFMEGITRLIGGDRQTILVTTRYKKKFLEWLIARSSARVLAQITAVPLLLIPSD